MNKLIRETIQIDQNYLTRTDVGLDNENQRDNRHILQNIKKTRCSWHNKRLFTRRDQSIM